jgi:pimeloyl-ACP methyl ester carboxylesterase
VLLVGHSWGSALAVYLLKRRPELFSAYVGTEQLVNMRRNEEYNYRRQFDQPERLDNREALRASHDIGPPPFSDHSSLRTLREWADRLAEGTGDSPQPRPSPLAPDFSADEVPAMMKGFEFSQSQLSEELNGIDLPSLGAAFDVPIFFFEGTHDQQTPMEWNWRMSISRALWRRTRSLCDLRVATTS